MEGRGSKCYLCGKEFNLCADDDIDCGPPHALTCGHVACTSCLKGFQADGVISCLECESLDMDKLDETLDGLLDKAAQNLTKLEQIQEILAAGREEQIDRERVRLEREIQKMADKAFHAVEKWKDRQLNQLSELDQRFPTSQKQLFCVQEKLKALKITIQWATKVRQTPILKQSCALNKVMETLQHSDFDSFDMKCISLGSGLSYVFQLKDQNQNLSLSLKMEVGPPKGLPKLEKPNQEEPVVNQASADVIIEEIVEHQDHAATPTGPELAEKSFWKRRNRITKMNNMSMWVVVTSIVDPSHFYVQYLAEARENMILSKKISFFCSKENSCFTSKDIVETGSMVFATWKQGLWGRASVIRVFQRGSTEAVKGCPADQLASVKVFCVDYGITKTINMESDTLTDIRNLGPTESSLNAVNEHMRKVGEAERVQLHSIAPLAIRCGLKNLVPYSLAKGWTEEAQVEFQKLVGSSALDMKILSRDKDLLMVDLIKTPMDQSCNTPISVRQYLVFIEVARFYAPVVLEERKQLQYYHPVCPKADMEINAVVSHINNPADFYIQVVENMELTLLSAQLQDCYNAATNAANLTVYCPVIGQAYVARDDDKLWHRAQVISHPGDGQVEICYVDLGSKKIVSVTDLRRIKDEFFALPIMAIHCCLEGIVPSERKTWDDSCTERFISLVHQKVVIVVPVHSEADHNPKPLLVRMFMSNLKGPKANIAELLVKKGLPCFREGPKTEDAISSGNESVVWDPPLEPSLTASDVDSTSHKITIEHKKEVVRHEVTLKLPAQLKDLMVRVSHVNSPSSFYVQLTQHLAQLSRVCELLKECARAEIPDGFEWRADLYCAADINGVWERGRICSDLTSSSIAEVMRCDYGNMVKLHISNLRPLPPSLIGSFALECTLTDIRPAGGQSTWTATACDLISCYLTGASALITIKEEVTDLCPVPVTLSCVNEMGQHVNIADFLVSKGLALRERKPRNAVDETPKEAGVQSSVMETQADVTRNFGSVSANVLVPLQISAPSTHAHPKLLPRSVMAVEKVKTLSTKYRPPELPRERQMQIRVVAVGDDGLIYMRTPDTECRFEQLMETIQQSLKTLPRQKFCEWKMVQGCAVMGSDMLWYRGEVVEVMGEYVTVKYVDSGMHETIPVVHIYPVLLCEDVPQLCVPCKLHGINPFGGKWQLGAVALLKEMLLNRTVDINVKELPSDPRAALSVEVFIDGMSVNTILSFHDHGSVDRRVSVPKVLTASSPTCLDKWSLDTEGLMDPLEPILGPYLHPDMPKEGDQFHAQVRHMWTPNKLFLMPLEWKTDLKVEGETLDDALKRVNADISNLPQLTSFPEDYPCLAEYSDGVYYRATITKITSVEPVMIMVHHVDFGSDDTLPTSKIRQIPAQLLKFPVRVLRVKVAGFKPLRVSKHKDVLPYCPEWSLKATMEMMDLLQTRVRASVVACEPELTVLLFNKQEELVHLPLIRKGLAEPE